MDEGRKHSRQRVESADGFESLLDATDALTAFVAALDGWRVVHFQIVIDDGEFWRYVALLEEI